MLCSSVAAQGRSSSFLNLPSDPPSICMDRIQISMETDCIKLVKLYQAHTGKSVSQIGNAALREYLIDVLAKDSDFRVLAMAMRRETGSLVDAELSKEKYNRT